jgi:hypothetical protein
MAAMLCGPSLAPLVPALAKTPAVYVAPKENIAVGGYDRVAYFVSGTPSKGDSSIATRLNGATWLFSRVENRTHVLANPANDIAQCGGSCEWGARGGLTTTIHALADTHGLPVVLKLPEGRAQDERSAIDMLETSVTSRRCWRIGPAIATPDGRPWTVAARLPTSALCSNGASRQSSVHSLLDTKRATATPSPSANSPTPEYGCDL